MRLAITDRLRRRQELHTYRQRLTAALATDVALRSLPTLRSLPYVGQREDGHMVEVTITMARQGMLLRGGVGSGRRLLIAQLAHAWLAAGTYEKPVPLPIDLTQLDDGVAAPNTLLTALVAGLDQSKRDDHGSWVLLLSGWEDLPPMRRSVWRSALVARLFPQSIQLGLVAAPIDEPAWPGLTTLTLPVPGPDEAKRWLSHLMPTVPFERFLPMLGPLPRLVDCVLLALLHTNGHVPATRVERERHALALLQAYRPHASGVLAAIGSGTTTAYAQRAIALEQAAQIVRSGSYQRLLEHPFTDDRVLLAAGLADETDQLLGVLGRHVRQHPHLLLVACRCLADHAPRSSLLTLLFVRALGQSVCASDSYAPDRSVLVACLPALDHALEQAVWQRADRLIQSVLRGLPVEDAIPRLFRLAYTESTPERIAWSCAKHLSRLPNLPYHGAPEGPRSLARWAFVQALGGPTGHAQFLHGPSAQALRELANAAACYREPAAKALLANRDLPILVRLSALQMIGPLSHTGSELLSQLACDPNRAMRMAALTRLVEQNRQFGGQVAAQLACDQRQAWDIRSDALHFLAHSPLRIAGPALIACATDSSLPLHLRIEALRSRWMLRNARPALIAVARQQHHDPTIRAAALRLIAMPCGSVRRRRVVRSRRVRATSYRFAHVLAWLLEDQATPLAVARVACDLLAAHESTLAVVTLMGVLERATTDIERSYAAIVALGRLRGERVVQALALLLGADALTRLQHGYPAALLRLPAAQALSAAQLPAPLRRDLHKAIELGLRVADRPTTLQEFLLTAADRLRMAAAQALARIGGMSVRVALVDALITGECATATPVILDVLVQVCGPDDARPLAQIIQHPATTARVRWLVVQRLADHPAALELLLAYVNDVSFDTLTRAMLAAALGRRRDANVLPLLSTIAQNRMADSYVREHALVGLGSITSAASDALLLRIAADPTEPPRLRGVAASQISPAMDAATHWALRHLVHHERMTADVLIGGLVALGRARDREALPLLMQYSHDQRSDVARAAIDGLVAVHDSTISSVLVGLSQKVQLDRVLRLHAVGALLRMGDADGPLLIRDYLYGPSLLLQMQALELMLTAGVSSAQLQALAADSNRAVAFRLRALDGLSSLDSVETLAPSVNDCNEPAEVRGRAIQLLTTVGGSMAHELLTRVAIRTTDHAGVRSCCVEVLMQRRDPLAAPILAQIAATDESQSIAEQAALALLELLVPQRL